MPERSKLLCVSLNPAVDRRIIVPSLRVGEVNRATSADPQAGGKAAHVAFAAVSLGAEVRWLAFLGGPDGESCRRGVEARGAVPVVVETAGRTRSTLELIDESTGAITEVLEPGPEILPEERDRMLFCFGEELSNAPVVALSGSLPRGIESSIYCDLIEAAKREGCTVLLDTSGAALEYSLKAQPSLIKPNRQEASALLCREIQTADDAIGAAQELRTRGSESVVLSLGAAGAVVADADGILLGTAPKLEVISTVGSGDSFLGGWAVGVADGLDRVERLRLAIACGTANCVANNPGVLDRKLVVELLQQVVIEQR
ncbi:1-phosphofructokinase [Candidatus Koribacter versatilis Ellin345]|uniref:1-phosphofructokinase n=1 Tax=Koribacter versatilis (strain Ellin345) TaxID=204669 RepID=Q1ITY4_KORVE|nr:1-phosphofructokinase family hexose kinase [Candidatus Koribacter versatilis]ABF39666.1 1-phosphofructokinase [Candidatus Koribacter versatilis Ellin345]